jgi:hypothetical protein
MAHVRWERGGEAEVAAADDDRVVFASSIPSAPGSRLTGALATGTPVRVKVARCRRQGSAPDAPIYVIEGRLLDATRADRDEIRALCAPPADPS